MKYISENVVFHTGYDAYTYHITVGEDKQKENSWLMLRLMRLVYLLCLLLKYRKYEHYF